MFRRSKLFLRGAALVGVGILGFSGTAEASGTWDTGTITVQAETRAVRLAVGDFAVSVDKVSNPAVRVKVDRHDPATDVRMKVWAAGENSCSAKDDVMAGTLNRTVYVHLGQGSATVYAMVRFTQTNALGLSTTTTLEPFGTLGTTVSPLVYVSGDLPPIHLCVA